MMFSADDFVDGGLDPLHLVRSWNQIPALDVGEPAPGNAGPYADCGAGDTGYRPLRSECLSGHLSPSPQQTFCS
jgi:hypothetical protein